MAHTRPLPEDDDSAADLLAAELESRALQDPHFRRALLRRLRASDGQDLKPACEMTLDELASRHRTDRHTLKRIAKKAIQKLRHTPEIRSLKS